MIKKQKKKKTQKLAKLEEERRKMDYSIAEQRRKLKMLKAESEINVGSAKIKALQAAINPPSSTMNSAINHQPFADTHKAQEQFVALQPVKSPSIYPLNPDAPAFNPTTTTRTAYQDTQDHQRDSFLATSIANAMDRNRLPVPTPKPFSGDPMEYISFKRSFKTLIEKKAISAEEKIYYLQQYLQGDAKQAVARCFYGTQESDYHQAWQTLEKRFGHSFRIQESFRKKLEDWPKLNIKDCTGLQRYADILKSCLDAMPHINGLQVLNDCKENQKIVSKLPDILIARWSRIVTEYMDEHAAYPLFSRFVSFVEREARIACNPIASFAAVKGQVHNFKPNKEEKNKARTLTVNTKQHAPSEPKGKKSNDEKVCPYCKGTHYLPNCEQFQAKDHEEKTSYILEAKRCFGCLRTGHFSHACPDRHKCRTCHRSHPTVFTQRI